MIKLAEKITLFAVTVTFEASITTYIYAENMIVAQSQATENTHSMLNRERGDGSYSVKFKGTTAVPKGWEKIEGDSNTHMQPDE